MWDAINGITVGGYSRDICGGINTVDKGRLEPNNRGKAREPILRSEVNKTSNP